MTAGTVAALDTRVDAERGSGARLLPLTGIGFVVCFVGSVVASNPPSDNASDAEWQSRWADHAHQLQPFATGVLLMLAGLCLATFVTAAWTRVAAAAGPVRPSPLPVVAAGVSAACIAVGGVLFAGIAGAMIFGSLRLPGADLLRFSNDLGFGMVGTAGMWAAALSVASLSRQARAAGVFGHKLSIFGVVAAVVLVAAPFFFPIAVLLVWLVIAAVVLLRA